MSGLKGNQKRATDGKFTANPINKPLRSLKDIRTNPTSIDDWTAIGSTLPTERENPDTAIDTDFSEYPHQWGKIQPSSKYGFALHPKSAHPFYKTHNLETALPNGEKLGVVKLPADATINTIQSGISVNKVRWYRKNPMWFDAPKVYEIDGEYWLADGHHKLASILPRVRSGEVPFFADVERFTKTERESTQ